MNIHDRINNISAAIDKEQNNTVRQLMRRQLRDLEWELNNLKK